MTKRFISAMAAYAFLALLAGLTLDNAVLHLNGFTVDLRVAVWLLLGAFALKTYIAHKAGW